MALKSLTRGKARDSTKEELHRWLQFQKLVASRPASFSENNLISLTGKADLKDAGFGVTDPNHVHNATVWNDRGDATGWDVAVGAFTTDGDWHDLDLSSVVSAGGDWILLRVQFEDDATESLLEFRENGNSNAYNCASCITRTADVQDEAQLWVKCDSGRVIEYRATNTTWTTINLCVMGWIS